MPSRVAAVLSCLALATSGVMAAGDAGAVSVHPAASATTSAKTHGVTVRVFQQNIEGAVDKSDTRLQDVRNAVGTFDPQVVMLEEFCHNRLAEFHDDFPGYRTVYTPMLDKPGCKDGSSTDESVGELLAGEYGLTHKHVYPLPGVIAPDTDPDGRMFHLTCADVTLPDEPSTALRACVTHTRSGHRTDGPPKQVNREAEREKQTQAIARITTPWVGTQRVVVAGDFNDAPTAPSLGSMYALDDQGAYRGAGHFVESDQTDSTWFPKGCSKHCRSGQATVVKVATDPRRFDDIFYSRTGTSGLHGVALAGDGSDHLPIRSTATLQLP